MQIYSLIEPRWQHKSQEIIKEIFFLRQIPDRRANTLVKEAKGDSMKTILIAGITGHQGQSVYKAQAALGNRVIGLTRNIASKRSKELIAQGCQLIACDFDKPETLKDLPPHDISFLVTDFWAGKEKEIVHGKNFIDAVMHKTSHIIFSSTLTSNLQNTFAHSDSKFEIEAYLKRNFKQYTILRLAFFMEVFREKDFVPAVTLGMMKKNIAKNTRLPFVSISDIGKMVAHISKNSSLYYEKELNLISDYKTMGEVISLLAKHNGKKPFYFPLPNFIFSKFVSSDLLAMWNWFSTHSVFYASSEIFLKEAHPTSFNKWIANNAS